MSKLENKNIFRDKLLSQEPHSAEMYEKYKKEVNKMLEKETKALRISKWLAMGMWVPVVCTPVIFFYLKVLAATVLGPSELSSLVWLQLGFIVFIIVYIALIFVVVAVIRTIAYHIHHSRVEILKEMKEMQLQMLELRNRIEQKQ